MVDATRGSVEVAEEPPFRSFGGISHQTVPDLERVRSLYVDDGLTEREIAKRVGVSRRLVAEALAKCGVERRRPRRECPISTDALRALYVDDHLTVAEIAKRLGAAHETAQRWLSEAGLGDPDPRIDHRRLRQLYVDEGRTVTETAAAFGVRRSLVIRELGLAGIAARSAHERRPRDARLGVTREALVQLYVEDRLSVVETARTLGVSTEYLAKQMRAHGIAKRPGSFTPRSSIEGTELVSRCVELYEDQQLTMGEVADQLGVSKTTVRNVLHESKVAVRPGGFPHISAEQRSRHLLSDLYSDEEVTAALVRHGVAVQDPASWRPPAPTETVAPLPLSRDLLVDLYIHVGLSIFHIGLVCGVGKTHVDARLKHFAIPRRSPQSTSPWMERTYGR